MTLPASSTVTLTLTSPSLPSHLTPDARRGFGNFDAFPPVGTVFFSLTAPVRKFVTSPPSITNTFSEPDEPSTWKPPRPPPRSSSGLMTVVTDELVVSIVTLESADTLTVSAVDPGEIFNILEKFLPLTGRSLTDC